MISLAPVRAPLRALVDPADGTPAAVDARRWFWALLAVALAVSASGAATALRWDATPKVVAELMEKGELQHTSEREIAESAQTQVRIRLVAGVAKGVFLMPLLALAIAIALKFVGWLFGTRAAFAKCFSTACIALLPVALYHAILALSVWRQAGITDSSLGTLVPTSLAVFWPQAGPKVARVLGAVDFFNLWSAMLVGFGFAAASGMRRHRALLLAALLYAMYAGVFLIGLPAIVSAGMGGGGGGHP